MSHVLIIVGMLLIVGVLGYFFIGKKKAVNNATYVPSANNVTKGKAGGL